VSDNTITVTIDAAKLEAAALKAAEDEARRIARHQLTGWTGWQLGRAGWLGC
jgi:hypothetical protein